MFLTILANIVLMFMLIGWVINASVFQVKYGLTWGFWANVFLANFAAAVLVYRLS